MVKMFDKVSLDFMNAIKGVLEAKNVNKHGHDHVGKEDDDIDNDGDTDKSDKYLHNRRKAIGKSINMKKESKDDVPFEGPYRTAADRKDEYGNKIKNVAKHLAKKAMNAKAAMKEDSEQVDEMSSKMKMKLGLYGKKKKMKEGAEELDEKLSDEAKAAVRFAAGGAGAKVKPLVKLAQMGKKVAKEEVDPGLEDEMKATRQTKKSVADAKKKYGMKEEADQIDELSKSTIGGYINKAKDSIDTASYRQGNKEALGGSSKPLEKKLTKRHKGISMAVDKLTKEEIEMIEAKLAGVADGAMEGDKHMCATKVFHKEWNEGTPITTMHADPDAEGLIEWYDVMFDHGIERVMTEDMEVLQAESHMHSKKKMKEEAEDLDEARGRPKKAGQMDYTVHPRTKEKLMHNNPEHMKKIEALQKNGILEKPKTEANQHIMNQLQKAKLSMQGGSTIQFTHGSAKHVSGTHAAKLLTKYAGMKPDEKEAFQKKIGHSHEQLMKHV